MTSRTDTIFEPLRRAGDTARTRDCLRCRTPFESEWSGERICRTCKSKQAWRSGSPHVFGRPGRG
ncbi:hypothetical protein P2H44_22350 [Albimonas sp. CAU 1670]|uniref:hypothetical protein n=1 Tax=Albimonas sp. CAU 1670 TaxID=3032599 RepID=UPI0023DAEA56|nr:hypothetical protein [Albimonas sp. CAU 1670]MDF2235309.1 hypothetical protein [Albimonas sp. CAU 1670]